MLKLVSKVLDIPLVFDLQQKFFNDYERVAEEFSEYLTKPSLDILDVGCSTGACAATVVEMQRHRYTGIDADAGYIEIASRRHRYGRFLAMDARDMTFQDDSFDLIMFVGILHHMDDGTASASLGEAARVLRPGGHALVAEPVFEKGRWLSSLLLSMDRGKYIRTEQQYESLFRGLAVCARGHFRLSFHRFCSFVLRK